MDFAISCLDKCCEHQLVLFIKNKFGCNWCSKIVEFKICPSTSHSTLAHSALISEPVCLAGGPLVQYIHGS